MASVAVVTDSGAALSKEQLYRLLEVGGFAVVDMQVSIAGLVHNTSSSEIHESIVVAHALGEQILTSAPSPGAFSRVYAELAHQGYEAIVSIHLAAELSSTVVSARLAATQSSIPVYVIDSRTVAMAYGYAVLYAHELAHRGVGARDIASVALEICENSELYFMIPTLDAIRRGGRVHPTLARVGQLLQIRPVGTVINGKLSYLERPRTVEKAYQILLDLAQSESRRRSSTYHDMEHPLTPSPSGSIVAVQYCGKEQDAHRFFTQLELKTSEPQNITPLPAVLSAHAGVGALAVVIY